MDFGKWEALFWARGLENVAGVDEAGRGPLAGPVVAAAVVLGPDFPLNGLDDSKKLSPSRRVALYKTIFARARCVGLGVVGPEEIDRINILQAALLCMSISVDNLGLTPDHVLVDGPHPFPGRAPQTPIKGGDGLCASIAAASVVAKVTRDRLMEDYDRQYPEYGFARHKGYGTAAHRAAIRAYGPCPIHRRSFKLV